MKKKWIVLIVVIISISLFLVWCNGPKSYNYINPIDQIDSICIVDLSLDENNCLVTVDTKQIEDTDKFIDDFSDVDCFTWYGDPVGALMGGQTEDKAIKVLYKNGEYEIINWCGQSKCTIERGFYFYTGFNVFEEEQFEALIDEYLSETITTNEPTAEIQA